MGCGLTVPPTIITCPNFASDINLPVQIFIGVDGGSDDDDNILSFVLSAQKGY